MTREEAINQLQDAEDGYKEYLTDEALDMAIQTLESIDNLDIETVSKWCKEHNYMFLTKEYFTWSIEQEKKSVIDKIKAEIEQDIAEANNLLKDGHDERVFGCICGYEEVLKIIDKYVGD